jgi:iron complex transport system substrate-binding protein
LFPSDLYQNQSKGAVFLSKVKKYLVFITAVLIFIPVLAEAAPKRIVSMSPVGTEILFDLGQASNVIAVTNFCDYPSAAMRKPKIGDFAAINFEKMISMRTDLLVLQDMHVQFIPQLDKLKIPYIVLKQNSIDEICDSVKRLGKITCSDKKADRLVSEIRKEVADVTAKVKGHKKPRVVLCVSRELSEPQINTFYAAGRNNFYNQLVTLAGGENALAAKGSRISYPQVALEGLMQINPDVLIDLVGEKTFYHSKDNIDVNTVFKESYLKGQWERSANVNAVRNGRIYIMDGTVFLRPGPRVGFILKTFARAIHPEIKW